MNLKQFLFLGLLILVPWHRPALASSPARFGETLCEEARFSCLEIGANDRWETLWPDPKERDIVRRLNRMNVKLKAGMRVAVPKDLKSLSDPNEISPFPRKIEASGEKEIFVDLTLLAWGAYDADGTLMKWGPAAGGKKFCPDTQLPCRTLVGERRLLYKGGKNCKSGKFPLPCGGAPMPYCMFFSPGFAIHGSPEVPGHNASHGCVRVFPEDAEWLSEHFAETEGSTDSSLGTRVTVYPYEEGKPPSSDTASSPTPVRGDGRLRLFNYHLQKFAEIQFRKDDQWDPQALEKISWLLRSRDGSPPLPIDRQLLDLMDYVQDFFGIDTVEIISGYRSPTFNEALLRTGHKVSPASYHTLGRAVDIHLDEIREETLKTFLLKLKVGGVGFYGDLDFVHADTGPFRFWEEASASSRKFIGVLDPASPFQLESNANEYLPGGTPLFTWKLQGEIDLSEVSELKLERFWRGKWVTCRADLPRESQFPLATEFIQCPVAEGASLFGKYRLTFHGKGSSERLSSNEFYLKKE